MQNGAAGGVGIYMATTPHFASKYAFRKRLHPKTLGWHGSAIGHVGVLLGCEYYEGGYDDRIGPIFVVGDPSSLILRYVWLIEPMTYNPFVVDEAIRYLPMGGKLEKFLEST